MRLTSGEIIAIKAAASRTFGDDAIVRVFGSRVDDSRRGGDIDLHLEIDTGDPTREREVAFRVTVADALDGEALDVAILKRGDKLRWIDRIALRDGKLL